MSLEDVKAGDWVALNQAGYDGRLSRGRVTKVTAAQITVGTSVYWKKNGRQVGCSNDWHPTTIEPMTPQLRDMIRRAELVRSLSGKNDWCLLPLETLESIWSLVEAARKAKEAGG